MLSERPIARNAPERTDRSLFAFGALVERQSYVSQVSRLGAPVPLLHPDITAQFMVTVQVGDSSTRNILLRAVAEDGFILQDYQKLRRITTPGTHSFQTLLAELGIVFLNYRLPEEELAVQWLKKAERIRSAHKEGRERRLKDFRSSLER